MKTLRQILENLTEEQKQLLADTIIYGEWGDCNFDRDGVMADGFITDEAYKGGHFVRRSLSNRFQSLFKALGLEGNRHYKESETMKWMYDWWGDGSGSILLVREEISDEIREWASAYNNLYRVVVNKDGEEIRGYRRTYESALEEMENYKAAHPFCKCHVEKIVWE